MSTDFHDPYGVWKRRLFKEIPQPEIDYLPPDVSYPAKIGIIGCDNEIYQILTAYLRADYAVVAFFDPNMTRATTLRNTFYPNARVYGDYHDLLADSAINIVDVSGPVSERRQIIADALRAGKHVLTQKYFIDDLDTGEELVELARECKVKFAVNEDTRWVPSYRFALEMLKKGYIGDVLMINFLAIWNHNYIKGTPLDEQKYGLGLFGMTWIDLVNAMMGNAPARHVFASVASTPTQEARAPLLMQVSVQYENAQASISLHGDATNFSLDRMTLMGNKGGLISSGPERGDQTAWCGIGTGVCELRLNGDWVPGGFHGSMAELIRSIEENREPENSGSSVLKSYALSFAAMASAELGRPVVPGEPAARRFAATENLTLPTAVCC